MKLLSGSDGPCRAQRAARLWSSIWDDTPHGRRGAIAIVDPESDCLLVLGAGPDVGALSPLAAAVDTLDSADLRITSRLTLMPIHDFHQRN